MLFVEVLGRLPTTVDVALRSAAVIRGDDPDCVEACGQPAGARTRLLASDEH
jgi:hypothetical protein